MGITVDAHVLIYACRRITGSESARHRQMCDASEWLVKQLNPVRVSAVAWFEFLRGGHGGWDDKAKLELIGKKLQVLAVEFPTVVLAHKLMADRQRYQKSCEVCFTSKIDKPCPECGSHGSAVQKTNDSFIVATAALDDEPPKLYSFDSGVLAYQPFVSNLTIVRPPHPSGELFESTLDLPKTTPARDRSAEKSPA